MERGYEKKEELKNVTSEITGVRECGWLWWSTHTVVSSCNNARVPFKSLITKYLNPLIPSEEIDYKPLSFQRSLHDYMTANL